MIKSIIITVLCFCWTTQVFPQNNASAEDLRKNVKQCFELIKTSPENTFKNAERIEKEAVKINDHETEIQAIIVQCIYFRGNNDFEKMMSKAKLLFQKAKSFKSDIYQLMARRYLFEAYVFSGLPEKALKELEKGNDLMNKLNKNDSLHIVGKGDFLIAFSNYHAQKGNFNNQLHYLHMAGREFEKMPNLKYRHELLYINYSNLAAAYNELNQLDSAKFYTGLSESYNDDFNRTDTNINNLWVLGNVAMKEGSYEKAIHYFKEAEKLGGYKNHINLENLYDNIIISYKKISKTDSAKIYESKSDSLRLTITENQNKSLHQLLKEKEENQSNRVFYFLSFILIAVTIFTFIVVRKNKLLARQEKASQKYLAVGASGQNKQNYTQLRKMLEEGDPAFMNYFDEIFPGFSQRLLEVNPKIIQSEIEFCSLLKLKIPTKDIARYKFVTPKTVQNKKYLIRKKLNIPKDIDIYQWFDSL